MKQMHTVRRLSVRSGAANPSVFGAAVSVENQNNSSVSPTENNSAASGIATPSGIKARNLARHLLTYVLYILYVWSPY